MDAQTRKAMFRAKLKESSQKREKRIDSPLVRYNEFEQAVCKVCNVVIKSESLWNAHLASRKHNEAVEEIKARATKSTTVNDSKLKQTDVTNLSSVPGKVRPSSSLPVNFFCQPDAKRQNQDSTSSGDNKAHNKITGTAASSEEISYSTSLAKDLKRMTSETAPPSKDLKKKASETIPFVASLQELRKKTLKTVPSKIRDVSTNELKVHSDMLNTKEKESISVSSAQQLHDSNLTVQSEGNQVKGSLPEGFFDNKDADLRARGLEPVKYDIKDEWKEFQKTIQEDLQEVDYRLEEEEFDAAELREEMELIEQRAYVDRVEMLKNKQQEISKAKASAQVKSPSYMGADSSDASSSDEDEDEDNYLIDWRAKRF